MSVTGIKTGISLRDQTLYVLLAETGDEVTTSGTYVLYKTGKTFTVPSNRVYVLKSIIFERRFSRNTEMWTKFTIDGVDYLAVLHNSTATPATVTTKAAATAAQSFQAGTYTGALYYFMSAGTNATIHWYNTYLQFDVHEV